MASRSVISFLNNAKILPWVFKGAPMSLIMPRKRIESISLSVKHPLPQSGYIFAFFFFEHAFFLFPVSVIVVVGLVIIYEGGAHLQNPGLFQEE
jgi:hypothetical protein